MKLIITTAVILGVNIISYLVVWYDKKQAKTGGWRVPEKRFLFLSFIGGATGIYLGMRKFRHKTKHALFIYGIPIMIIVNVTILYFILSF